MPHLALYLLGAPRVVLDERPLEFDTRKAVALLAYLAVTQRPHSRDALAALLWPDYEDGRGALRRTLSTLNRALGGAGLVVERDLVSLAPAQLQVDVTRFDQLLATAAAHGCRRDAACAQCGPLLEEAAALYRGDFLQGFSLRDSAPFEEWQYFEAERLRRALAEALERLSGCLLAAGRTSEAIAQGRRWLALDPLSEAAHRALMRLYVAAGERGAALRQYQECRRILESELGVEPLEETTALHKQILDGELRPGERAPARPEAPPSLPSAPTQPPTIVGRAAELRALLDGYEGAAKGSLAVIEGEPGVGKSRLVAELLARVEAKGGRTLTARCYEGEQQLAYGPVSALLRAAAPALARADLAEHHLAEAARLAPELARGQGAPAAALDSPAAQTRFFEGVTAALLAAVAGAQPGLIVVDDCHWADSASVELLAYLARRLDQAPACLALCWRTAELPAEHPLRRALGAARREGRATFVQLEGLSEEAVADLARARAPGLAPEVLRRLFRESEGLPLLVVEYLDAIERGDLDPSGATWTLPGGARDLLVARLQAAGETARQLLAAAAAIGRSFDFDTLRGASGRSEEETIAGLDELAALGLVAEAPGATTADGPLYDFRHDKLRALVYEELSAPRRRLLHRRIAEALAAGQPGRRPSPALAARMASHYRLAGMDAAAAAAYRKAGDEARALYANAEALAHYNMALELGLPERAALHEAIGDLQALAGNYAAALASYAVAAVAGPAHPAALARKRGELQHRLGEWNAAEALFAASLALLPADGSEGERAYTLAAWSLTARRRGEMTRARSLARQALHSAEAAGDQKALARAHTLLGSLARPDDPQAALPHLTRGLELARAVGDLAAEIGALNSLALARADTGDQSDAIALAQEALAICERMGDRHRAAALHNTLSDLLHSAGRRDEARDHLRRAVAAFADVGAGEPEIWRLTEW